MNIKLRLSVRQSLGSAFLISGSLVPSFLLAYWFSVPILVLGTVYLTLLSLGAINAYQTFKQSDLDLNNRQLNLQEPKEQAIFNVITRLAHQAQIPVPTVLIMPRDVTKPKMEAFSIGSPFRQRVQIQEDIIDIFDPNLNGDVFEALFAHEIAHLQQNSTRSKLVSQIFIDVTLAYFLMGICALASILVTGGLSLLLFGLPLSKAILLLGRYALTSVLVLGGQLFLDQWVVAMKQRVEELLADLNGAQWIQTPLVMATFMKRIYFQYLHWGIFVHENALGQEVRTRIADPESKQQRLRELLQSSIATQDAFVQAVLPQLPGSSPAPLLSYHRARTLFLSFYNTHPTLDQREAVLLESIATATVARHSSLA